MAARTPSLTLGLTRGDPFTTRETVARDTPARRATSSRVALVRWLRPLGWATGPPMCVRALSRSI